MPLTYYTKVVLPVRKNLQDVSYDCGPASLLIILSTLGIQITEKELMRRCKTNFRDGTTPEDMIAAFKEMKIAYQEYHPASIRLLQEQIRTLHLCMVDYQAWGDSGSQYKGLDTGHYSVVFGYNKTHLWIADPAKHKTKKQKKKNWGARKVRKDVFNKHWADKETDGTKTSKWMVAVPLVQPIMTPFMF